jgi:predicted ATPase
MEVSGLEDEYLLASGHPKLLYLKEPAEREPRLDELLDRIRADGDSSYRRFDSVDELARLVQDDLALLLTERFELTAGTPGPGSEPDAATATAPIEMPALPAPPGPLIGRDAEVSGVIDLLVNPDVRLVTLVGAGGTGKTRLALCVAEQLRNRFEAGVCFVDLTGVRDPTLVMPTVAGAMGVHQSNTRTLVEALSRVFRDRELLVVLDNFEQVLDAAPELAELLTAAPGLTVLVTSRQPLRLRWEHDYPVLPLDLPNEQAGGVHAIGAASAVELFVEAARRVRPTFSLDESNAAVVAELCRRLDGLPLALELAAARLRMLTPADLLARLDSALDLLEDGSADAPERHQTLRSTIDWSHDLLPPAEQALFRRLSVFAGGCDLDAIESVCLGEPLDRDRLLGTLGTLVDQSLLVSEADVAVAPTRFRMLETIREYAAERLEAAGEVGPTREAHLQWVIALLAPGMDALWTAEMNAWLAVFQRELDNVRVALDRAAAAGRWEEGLRAASHWLLWDTACDLREGQARLRELLAVVPPGTRSAGVAQGNLALGWLTALLGDFDEAIVLMREGIAQWRELDDPTSLTWALVMTGNVAFNLELADEAGAVFTEGLEIGRRLDSDVLIGWAEFGLAHVALLRGDLDEAVRVLEVGLVRAEHQGVPWAIAWVRFSQAVIHLLRDDTAAARRDVVESLRQRWTVHDVRGLSDSLTLLACLDSADGDDDWALLLHGAAEVQRDATGLTVLPWLRDMVDASVDGLRDRVEPARFRDRWNEGRTRPLDKVVSEALDQRAEAAQPTGRTVST